MSAPGGTPQREPWIRRAKEGLRRSVLFPRWIGAVHIEPVLRRSRAHVTGTLLDVGCGRRPYEEMFRGHATRYVGMDRPRRAEDARPHVVGDAEALPFASGSVDTVLATELVEHLPRPEAFLAEAARVLRRPGALILSAPFMEPLHEEPRDFYRFTAFGLRALLGRHGFEVVELWPKGGWWSVVLGSFVTQTLYEWANPRRADGERANNLVALALVLPLCAAAQVVGYGLDRLVHSRRYTLGHVVVARRAGGEAGGGVA